MFLEITGPQHRSILSRPEPGRLTGAKLAGLEIKEVFTKAAGNGADIGGVKLVLANGSWLALRPKRHGTQNENCMWKASKGLGFNP